MLAERLVRQRGLRRQFRFATEAKRSLPERGDFLPAKSHRGLHLLARDEKGLAAPLGVLSAIYGEGVEIDRLRYARPVAELRVGLESVHVAAVRAALARRGINPSEEYLGMHYCVLRFEALLEDLFGLPGELARLCEGQANHQVLVIGYE